MRASLLLLFLASLAAQAPPGKTPPVNAEPELGQVHWLRDFAGALQRRSDSKKPVFLLFQEIPGCDTCTSFGKHVLGNPLLVAAIEACFVPVVVRNNVDGPEKIVLERFQEPAWNNPVVRFLDAAGKDLLPRKDGIYDAHTIASRMIEALERSKVPVPGYLLIARDEAATRTERAVFEMHCFWEGEAVLGAVPGVVSTRAAFVGGAEVVEVTFLPTVVPKKKLTELAAANSCKFVDAPEVKAAPPGDQQHALHGTIYATLDLTPMQRMKVHSALTRRSDPAEWLTPAQLVASTAARAGKPQAR